MRSRALAVGVVAFLATSANARAGIPSLSCPYRSRHAVVAGEEEVSLDRTALAALRSSGREPFRLTGFPTSPGVRSEVILRRFDITDPDARIRITGESGDTFRALPDIAHFEGRVPGEEDSVVYVAAMPDALVSWVRSRAGAIYVGPDEAPLRRSRLRISGRSASGGFAVDVPFGLPS
jgi:hypothetical protein